MKRAGIEATYAEPPNIFDRFFAGDYTGALFGHGGSYSSDVYYSLRLYQTASEKIPGGHLVNFSLWHNDEYDKLVDELYGISPTETDKVMEIWKKCLAIWLPDYPDIQISQGSTACRRTRPTGRTGRTRRTRTSTPRTCT